MNGGEAEYNEDIICKGGKRLSLFNVHKWSDNAIRPFCCHVVPVLYTGMFDTISIDFILEGLKNSVSSCITGFMKPEGIVVYHKAGNLMFKKTIEKDEEHKGKSA